jgi:hypothetical protein
MPLRGANVPRFPAICHVLITQWGVVLQNYTSNGDSPDEYKNESAKQSHLLCERTPKTASTCMWSFSHLTTNGPMGTSGASGGPMSSGDRSK